MHKDTGNTGRLVLLLVMITVLLAAIVACDNDDDQTTTAHTDVKTTRLDQTERPVSTDSPSPPPANNPVKIGAISSWSGPLALAGIIGDDVIALVEDQVTKMGGILDGRPVKVTIYDDAGQVSKALSGWSKLVLDDKVSAIVYGGMTGATTTASADAAQDYETPYFNMSPIPDDLSDLPYTVRCTYKSSASAQKAMEFVINELKPDTAAILTDDDQAMRQRAAAIKEALHGAGIDLVYEEYVPQGTKDFSPYLTNLQYAAPDVLIASHAPQEYYIQIFRQIVELGGWGDIKFISPSPTSTNMGIATLPGAIGTYHWVLWIPGLDYPGARQFEQDFFAKYGREPTAPHVFAYFPLWVAIEAIELAGTDTDLEAIAEAARSGELKWESPAGPLAIGTDGEPNLEGFMVEVKAGGELVPVTSQP